MKQSFDPDSQGPPKTGLVLLQVLIWVLFCIFALRFWYLQIYKGEEYAKRARENQLRQEAMFAPRGLVRDRNGKLLAVNEPAYALGLIREDVKDLDATLSKISEWTGLSMEELRKRYDKGRYRVKPFERLILVPELSFELLAQIEANALFWPGLEIVVRPKRYYPEKDLFAHTLGYVAVANEKELEKDSGLALGDDVGRGGLELVLESRLRGEKGLRQLEVDATGRRLNQKVLREPVAGENVTMSLDYGLQAVAAEQMKDKAGVVVVMDPDTGRILAFVSAPSYDTNWFVSGLSNKQWASLRDNPLRPLQNRVIQSMYPPGSVYKLVIGGAALKDDVDPSETVFCGGHVKLGRRIFRCWKKVGHGRVDYQKAQVHSCDVYFYEMGKRLGVDKMSAFAKGCGFGERTGISLPHEKGGLVPTREWKLKRKGVPWVGGDNLNMAIGQGFNLVTPMQVARFVGALINGGNLMRPLLLENAEPEVQGRVPMSDENRQKIVDAMIETVQRGTARRLRRKDAILGGKTGTAQVVKLKLKDGDKRRKFEEMEHWERDHAWLASFGMKDGRKYVAVCMVEHGGHGGSAAGPVLKKVYSYLFSEKMR